MIFYFSATGNSKYAAERIASVSEDHLISLRDAIRARRYRYDVSRESRIGFVVPVYFQGLPSILNFFLEKLELTGYCGQYIYAVFTCGNWTGDAAGQLNKALKKKGLALSAQFGVQMVDNYIPAFRIPDAEETARILDAAEETIDDAARAIRARRLQPLPRTRSGGPDLHDVSLLQQGPVHQAVCGHGTLHRLRAVPGGVPLRGHRHRGREARLGQAQMRPVPGMPAPLPRPGHPLEKAN